MSSDYEYTLYYSIVFGVAIFLLLFYYILAAIFVYEYFIAKFKNISYYRKLLYVCIFFVSIRLFYSSVSLFSAPYITNSSFMVYFDFIVDFVMLILLILILKKLYSPFYKAFFYMQKKDYVNFFNSLQKTKNWWKIHNFKGMSLFHYALYINDKNAIYIMLSKKLEAGFKEDKDEVKILDFINNIQEKGLSLNLDEKQTKELLFLRLGSNAIFKANNGLKNLRLNLKFLNSLSFASFCANDEIVDLLIKNGANVDDYFLLYGEKFYAESFAAINDNFIIVDYFFKKFKQVKNRLKIFYDKEFIDKACLYVIYDDVSSLQNVDTKDFFRLFYLAVALSKLKVLEYLLKNKCHLLDGKEKENLLELSVKIDSIGSFCLLEKYNFASKTIFFNAVCMNAKSIIKYMLDNNYTPNPQEMLYLYYLWFDSKSEDLFATLKEIGLNFRDKQGESPLISAAKYNLTWAAFELIEAGADTSIKDNNGKDALFYANEHKNLELIKMLKLKSDLE